MNAAAHSSENHVVIGSGPAGLAATMALLERGLAVTVVDAGARLEPEREALRQALAARPPGEWDPVARTAFVTPGVAAEGDILRYGSDFALRPAGQVYATPETAPALRSSHALGGLSNLWGAAVLPWRPEDQPGWPAGAGALAPHYRAVAQFMPVAGAPGALDRLFPAPDLARAEPLPESAQSRKLGEKLARAAPRMARAGLVAGPARQAVAPGCRACGLCLHGCPYGLIFRAGHPIEALAAEGRITYLEGRVTRLSEEAGQVRLDLADGRESLRAARAYVATGVLETALLQFASDPALAGREITLAESRHFFTPFLQRWGAEGTGTTPHHTLVLAFAELDDAAVSPWLVHSQLYGWNDFYVREMAERYGRGIKALDPLFAWLSRRLIVAQSFLHSGHCPEIALSPARTTQGLRLNARILPNQEFEATVARARRALVRGLGAAGLTGLTPASRIAAPGESFHLGASLPMCSTPGPGETDVLGRPHGRDRIHIVDASVLPEIAASTITFSVMANAHRIAATAGAGDA